MTPLRGRCAAREAPPSLDSASEHFREAIAEAGRGKWHLIAVQAAADWKRVAVGARGSDYGAEADAAIDAALLAMGKGREGFAQLLA